MWRDPLEELIEDLERAAPEPSPAGLLPIEEIQRYLDLILYGTDEEVGRLEADPAYQAWLRYLAEACGRGK